MQGVGHLPMVEQPEAYAALLKTFLAQIGHI
jgi:pimeloyl-ACP methyl ester carboxylesterase